MLFLVTQVHTPETCPKGEPGEDKLLFNVGTQGVTLKARYGAWSHHTVYYVVEASDFDAVQRFLDPGMKRAVCDIVPVKEASVS